MGDEPRKLYVKLLGVVASLEVRSLSSAKRLCLSLQGLLWVITHGVLKPYQHHISKVTRQRKGMVDMSLCRLTSKG